MRVALITQRFPPACCGVGDYTAELARTLAARGYDPVVFTATPGAVGANGVRVVSSPLRGRQDLARILQQLEAEQVDAVEIEYSGYGWSRRGFAFWVNTLVRRLHRRGLPVTIALHEIPLSARQHPIRLPWIILQWVHILWLVSSADQIVTNTKPRVQLLSRLLPWRRNHIDYRPNSSNIPVVRISADERDALRLRRGVTAEAFVVSCFGLFGTGKNYEAVIQAVANAKATAEHPWQLWLLGNLQHARPDYIAQLRSLVRNLKLDADVFWSGALSAAEVSAHLQASDVFMLPQSDGHLTRSGAFMAAAAHGLPVVAVRNPSHQTQFTHGKDIWLVDRSEPTALAAALIELAQRKELRNTLGQNLALLYGTHFDWKGVALPRAAKAHGVSPSPADAARL